MDAIEKQTGKMGLGESGEGRFNTSVEDTSMERGTSEGSPGRGQGRTQGLVDMLGEDPLAETGRGSRTSKVASGSRGLRRVRRWSGRQWPSWASEGNLALNAAFTHTTTL